MNTALHDPVLSEKKYLEKVPSDTRLLLIEDSGIQAKVFVNLLKGMGYESVSYCATSEEAVEKIKLLKPKLVFCDWDMPGKNGIEILKEIRLDPSFSQLPFIFITAHAEKERVIEALKSGASDYIVKPPTAGIVAEKLLKIKLS